MERITEQELLLWHYLDGQLDEIQIRQLKETFNQNPQLKARLEEFRLIHNTLASKAKLESPSKKFTETVMKNLDFLPQRSLLSPKKGLLLLCGMVVAVGALSLLMSYGVFDNMQSVITIGELPIKSESFKNPLPSLPFNAKWLINGIMVLGLGLAFMILDRTVLKPYFERRSEMHL